MSADMVALITQYVIPATFALLPPEMRAPSAAVMLTAIGLQESRFLHRRQIGGPARGFWQFEPAGVVAVRGHQATRDAATRLLQALRYPATMPTEDVLEALGHNDVLACGCARLLLWASPLALPVSREESDLDLGWDLYVSSWRPGKPHPETWETLYHEAFDRWHVSAAGTVVA
jgi:hypothetical protein